MQRCTNAKIRKRWWLFRASDFQSSMCLCITFCQAFGMFPYKMNASTFEASKPRYILSTLIVCVCCIINAKVIYDIVTSKIIVRTIAKTFESVCYIICSGAIMIFTYTLSGPRMHLLQTILEISSKLPPKIYQKLSRSIQIKDILGTILIIIGTYKYNSNTLAMGSMNDMLKIINITFSLYYSLLIFHLNMLYVNCICVLKLGFKSINDNLALTQRLAINKSLQSSSTLIYPMQGNQFLLMKLKELKEQHLMVSDAVKMLNIISSPQLVATVVIIFSVMTFELYYLAVRWQHGFLLISFDKQLFDMVICSVISHFILLSLLVWACETCKNEAYEIRTTIHDFFNSVTDEEVKDELHLFSLQTLHCKNIFSAKGLTVDAPFFAGMVSSIATYMLILMQFLIAVRSCDAKNL